MASRSIPRSDWSQVLAFTWWSTEADTANTTQFLNDLRQDPKSAINELASTEGGKYKDILSRVPDPDGNTRENIINAALSIKQLAEGDVDSAYRGYLPIPNQSEVGVLASLEREKLAYLLRQGITGILQFNDQADLWADELLEAWKNANHLKAILQDPAQNINHKGELKSVFPLPDLPRGLTGLTIDQLQEFLGDQDHMQHLGGIFLFGS